MSSRKIQWIRRKKILMNIGGKIERIEREGVGTLKIKFSEGHAIGELISSTEFRLDGFHIKEEFRGKGFGKSNYQELEKELKKLGVKRIYLQSLHHNIGFWKKMGFRIYQVLEPGLEWAMVKDISK
jgi:ribosomal protein S18 acetylase RimI-like enzyme